MADKKTELTEIKRFGGTPTKNSGRGKFNKGDAKVGPFTVDIKEASKTFQMSRTVWAKVSSDAVKNDNSEPALMIALGDKHVVRLWVVGDQMFQEMLDAWEKVYGGENV